MAERFRRPRRPWLLILIAVMAGVFVLLGALSGFYIDLLWFREVGFTNVLWTQLWSKVILGLTFGLLFFGALYANLLIVRRVTPRYQTVGP